MRREAEVARACAPVALARFALAVTAGSDGAALADDLGPVNSFSTLFDAHMAERLPAECVQLMVTGVLTKKGLLAAREGQLATARRHFDRVHAILKGPWSDEARLIARSSLLAAEAYESYRHGRYDEALARVTQAAECDLLLEDELGYFVCQQHRLQLLHNVMRVELRRGRLERGLSVAVAVLLFEETAAVEPLIALSLPWAQAWSLWSWQKTPETLRNRMHAQVANELVVALERVRGHGSADDKAALATALAAEAAALAGSPAQVARWLAAQAALAHRHEEALFAAALPLLRAGRRPSAPLWRSVVTDLAPLAAADDDETAARLRALALTA
jgi:hypothetical protein